MPLDDARNFVERMREDKDIRAKALQTKDLDDLTLFLQGEGLSFDQRELVCAMAECMAQMEDRADG